MDKLNKVASSIGTFKSGAAAVALTALLLRNVHL